ncbi:hypothetical protein QQ045_018653 [Rhodiola kirilowii]
MNERKIIELDQGWVYMQSGIRKLKNILEELTTNFSLTSGNNRVTVSRRKWAGYCEKIGNVAGDTFQLRRLHDALHVLPSLREKHDEFKLRELVRRWANHKVMVRWLSRFFYYLDRYFIARRSLLPLHDVGLTCFKELVYEVVKDKVRDAVITLIDQEREGEQIDRALLKNILEILVEIGMGSMEQYENDFEQAMLDDTAAYYSRKSSNWILKIIP